MIGDRCSVCGLPLGRIGAGWSTLAYCAPFVDKDGKVHHHDANRHERLFSCANGHDVMRVVPNSCWCGWTDAKEREVTA